MSYRSLNSYDVATAVIIIIVTAATESTSATGVLVDGSSVVGGINAGVGGVLPGGGGASLGSNNNAGSNDAGMNHFQTSPGIMDSSRVSTCLISMLLIVYGSFRSLNIEQEAREREQKKRNESMSNLLTGESVEPEQSKFYIIFNI